MAWVVRRRNASFGLQVAITEAYGVYEAAGVACLEKTRSSGSLRHPNRFLILDRWTRQSEPSISYLDRYLGGAGRPPAPRR